MLGVVLAWSGCGSKDETAKVRPTRVTDAAPIVADAGPRCVPDTRFAASLPIAEASGAVYVAGPSPTILVVGDSNTRGQLIEIDAERGKVLWSGRLPLDTNASDDLEGLAMRGGTLYAITSSGFMRHWQRTEAGFRQTATAYPLAARGAPPHLVCKSGHGINCERNYEGFCLLDRPVAAGGCVGFAASKKDGHLYCVVERGKRLAIDGRRTIRVARPGAVTGCHFSPEGDRLWVGTNFFGGSQVYEIRGFATPKKAAVEAVAALGSGFPEAIAIGPKRVVYRFSDTSIAPSMADKFRCR